MKRLLIALALAVIALPALADGTVNSFKLMPESGGAFSSVVRIAPTYVNSNTLTANSAASQTVPTGARFVIFSSTCNFYANPTTTATVPGNITNGSASELNPNAWFVTDVTTISMISQVSCTITTSFYK